VDRQLIGGEGKVLHSQDFVSLDRYFIGGKYKVLH
jgi:hypothetical protein